LNLCVSIWICCTMQPSGRSSLTQDQKCCVACFNWPTMCQQRWFPDGVLSEIWCFTPVTGHPPWCCPSDAHMWLHCCSTCFGPKKCCFVFVHCVCLNWLSALCLFISQFRLFKNCVELDKRWAIVLCLLTMVTFKCQTLAKQFKPKCKMKSALHHELDFASAQMTLGGQMHCLNETWETMSPSIATQVFSPSMVVATQQTTWRWIWWGSGKRSAICKIFQVRTAVKRRAQVFFVSATELLSLAPTT